MNLVKNYHFIVFSTHAVKATVKNNMENLPTEILEIVFHPLSKKEDIENCFNVNSKWRHIIENMFENKSIIEIYFKYIIPDYIFI